MWLALCILLEYIFIENCSGMARLGSRLRLGGQQKFRCNRNRNREVGFIEELQLVEVTRQYGKQPIIKINIP